jgi:transposase-like protein
LISPFPDPPRSLNYLLSPCLIFGVPSKFTAEYKAKILAAADRCNKPGEVGALLRREGLYSSHLEKWRAARRRGELAALSGKPGPKPSPTDRSEIAKLKADNTRLRDKLRKAEMLIDLQKKAHEILGIALPILSDSQIEQTD